MGDIHGRPHPASPLLDHCPPTLPAESYRDAAWFAREQERIFARSWIHLGRADGFAPGTIRRVTVAGQSILVVRDRDGGFSAVHNVCRHRGAELCSVDEKPLGARLITCPYHQWSYDLAGRLVRVPFALETADFDRADHGLFTVALNVWNGFLFACLADDPPDFAAAPDVGAAALDHWPMAGLVVGHRHDRILDCNWKIFWENYSECLHCPGIHPELSAMVPVYGRGIMAENEAVEWTPETPAPASNLRPGARSWTMDGAACGPEFAGLTEAEKAAGYTFVTLWPTMFVVAHVDYVRAVTLTPLAPERTALTAEWLFAPETLAQPGFDLASVVDFATMVLEQDGDACEMNQRGLRSSRYRAGRLMPQEYEIHRFHQWVGRMMAPAAERSGGAP